MFLLPHKHTKLKITNKILINIISNLLIVVIFVVILCHGKHKDNKHF